MHPRLATTILSAKHYPNTLVVKHGAKILKDDRILDEVYKWLDGGWSNLLPQRGRETRLVISSAGNYRGNLLRNTRKCQGGNNQGFT